MYLRDEVSLHHGLRGVLVDAQVGQERKAGCDHFSGIGVLRLRKQGLFVNLNHRHFTIRS
jgi:hypothetical protein